MRGLMNNLSSILNDVLVWIYENKILKTIELTAIFKIEGSSGLYLKWGRFDHIGGLIMYQNFCCQNGERGKKLDGMSSKYCQWAEA